MTTRTQEFLDALPRFLKPINERTDMESQDVLMDAGFLDTPLVGDTTLREHLMQVIDGMSATDVEKDTHVTMLLDMRGQLPRVGSSLFVCAPSTAEATELLRKLLQVKAIRQGQGVGAMTLPAYASLMKLRQDWEGWLTTMRPATPERST